MPSAKVAAPRGRLTSRVTPAMVPRRMVGTMRVHSLRTAFFGFSKPTRKALARSISTKSANAKGSGTKCVASGTVTSAAPKPVMPNTTDPAKAAVASAAISTGSSAISALFPRRDDEQFVRRPAVHRAQALHVARKRQAVGPLERDRARAQFAPRYGRRRALQADDDDVRVAQRLERDHRAAKGALDALQIAVEVRIVVHEVHHQRAGIVQRAPGGVEERLRHHRRRRRLVLV